MSVAEWTDTYGIRHWSILWSSYRKLAWVGFEPLTTEFRSEVLTDWPIRLWVQLTLRASFVQIIQFNRLFSVRFHFGYCFFGRHVCFNLFFLEVITWFTWTWTFIEVIHMIITPLFKVAPDIFQFLYHLRLFFRVVNIYT